MVWITRAAEEGRKSFDRRSHFRGSGHGHHPSFRLSRRKGPSGRHHLAQAWQRVVFFGGMALPVILLLIATLFPGALH
jgi:hypothetical protein